jgi:hypothetical protein
MKLSIFRRIYLIASYITTVLHSGDETCVYRKASKSLPQYRSVIRHETKNELEVTKHKIRKYFILQARQPPVGLGSSSLRFLDHNQTHHTR